MSLPIIDMYNRGEIDEVVLIYTSFISSMEQEAVSYTHLDVYKRQAKKCII